MRQAWQSWVGAAERLALDIGAEDLREHQPGQCNSAHGQARGLEEVTAAEVVEAFLSGVHLKNRLVFVKSFIQVQEQARDHGISSKFRRIQLLICSRFPDF